MALYGGRPRDPVRIYIYKFMYDYGEREKKEEEATQGELGKMRVIRHLIKE